MRKKPQRKKYVWHLPENMRKFRAKHTLTLDDVAFGTGLSKSYLSQLENGHNQKPSVQICKALADYFETDLAAFCFAEKM